MENVQPDSPPLRANLDPAQAAAITTTFKYDAFISLRFCEALTEAKALKLALESRGCRVYLCEVAVGESIPGDISRALVSSRMAIIMGTRNYGQKTDCTFSTHNELQYILGQKMPFFLIKMCDKFAEPETTLSLPTSISFFPWLPATEADRHNVPAQLVEKFMAKLQKIQDGTYLPAAEQKKDVLAHSAVAVVGRTHTMVV